MSTTNVRAARIPRYQPRRLATLLFLLTLTSARFSLSFNSTLFPFPFQSSGIDGQQSPTLLVEITLERVVLSAGIDTTECISFDHTFEDPIVVPILGKADSGVIEDVALTQGGLATLDIGSRGT